MASFELIPCSATVSSKILVCRNLKIILACAFDQCHLATDLFHIHQDFVTQLIQLNFGGLALASILIAKFDLDSGLWRLMLRGLTVIIITANVACLLKILQYPTQSVSSTEEAKNRDYAVVGLRE